MIKIPFDQVMLVPAVRDFPNVREKKHFSTTCPLFCCSVERMERENDEIFLIQWLGSNNHFPTL